MLLNIDDIRELPTRFCMWCSDISETNDEEWICGVWLSGYFNWSEKKFVILIKYLSYATN